MENNKVIIKGSFRGISGDFVKNLILLLLNFLIYLVCKSFQNDLYAKYNIKSFSSYVLKFENIPISFLLSFVFFIYIILVITTISYIFKTLNLFYTLGRNLSFDYSTGRIILKTYSFLLSKNIEENKFNEIINVNINQGLFNRIFNTGTVYIEYLTYNTVDSQLRTMEIYNVHNPFSIKNKIM